MVTLIFKTTFPEKYTLYVSDGTNTALYYLYGSALPEATVYLCATPSQGQYTVINTI